MKDLRTAVTALTLWGAALLCLHLPVLALPLAGACGVGAVGLVLARGVLRRRTGALPVLVLLCCAAVAVTVAASQPQRAQLGESDGRAVEAIIEVSSSASVGADGRLWFDAEAVGVGAPGAVRALHAPLRVGVDPTSGLDPGARLRVTGQGLATDSSERAGLVVFTTDVEVLQPASGMFAIAAATRRAFIARAGRLPEPGASLLPGLAVGDTTAVSPELNAAMRASGLSHLTAVSGDTDDFTGGYIKLCQAGLHDRSQRTHRPTVNRRPGLRRQAVCCCEGGGAADRTARAHSR